MNTTVEAVITAQASVEEVEAAHVMARLTVEPVDDASTRMRLQAEHVEWLAVAVAALPFPVEVHEPPELVEAVRAMAQRLHAAAP
jgi:hypothetical protein